MKPVRRLHIPRLDIELAGIDPDTARQVLERLPEALGRVLGAEGGAAGSDGPAERIAERVARRVAAAVRERTATGAP